MGFFECADPRHADAVGGSRVRVDSLSAAAAGEGQPGDQHQGEEPQAGRVAGERRGAAAAVIVVVPTRERGVAHGEQGEGEQGVLHGASWGGVGRLQPATGEW